MAVRAYPEKIFQPTLPARGATLGQPVREPQRKQFQPTLPARGATLGAEQLRGQLRHFNPRSPHGERPSPILDSGRTSRFQPTLPARGATRQRTRRSTGGEISTHAPRTGSDPTDMGVRRLTRYFNPRSPHGERRRSTLTSSRWKRFQPTLPARGATRKTLPNVKKKGISTHAPRTGSDAVRP